MQRHLLIFMACGLLAAGSAYADELSDAYDKGFKSGWDAGYAKGRTDSPNVLYWNPGTARTIGEGTTPTGGTIFIPVPETRYDHSGFEEFMKQGAWASDSAPKIMLPGQNFNTVIDATGPNAAFKDLPGSSIAIIPEKSLDAIKEKMGADFLKDGMVLNNQESRPSAQ